MKEAAEEDVSLFYRSLFHWAGGRRRLLSAPLPLLLGNGIIILARAARRTTNRAKGGESKEI